MVRWGRKFLWSAVLIMALTALAACGTNSNTTKDNVAKTENAEESTSASSTPSEGSGNASEEVATRTITGNSEMLRFQSTLNGWPGFTLKII